jgi:NADPH:quinone reductase-like Zn-dependent oxidoreductase/acyl carrier protein/NADP-dependent 3-hydroxy acid dehydrogenase YdfG
LGRHLVDELARLGLRVAVATVAADFAKTGPDRYRVNPARWDDLAALLAEVGASVSLQAVVHLWALDVPPSLDATGKELERAEVLTCGSVAGLVRALEAAGPGVTPRLWLVSQGAQPAASGDAVTAPFQAALWGLGRSLAGEHPGLRPALVDLDQDPDSVRALAAAVLAGDDEDQLALRGGDRLVARLAPHRGTPAPIATSGPGDGGVRVVIDAPGALDGLHLAPAPAPAPGPGEVLVRVAYASLNYRDVLHVTGMYPGQGFDSPLLGWECAGVVEAVGSDVTGLVPGAEVVALAPGALATHVVAPASLVARKPERLTPAEAATLPMAFLTAYHALHDLGRVGVGDRVLVHSATGGVGLAAVQVAHWLGARVHGTAGSPEKRAVLDLFGVKHVSDSRSLQFVEDFQSATGGAGFDVILNTLAGEAVAANLSLMAPYGRYLELSRRDILENAPVGLAAFERNLTFSAIDVAHMIREVPERAGRILGEVLRLVDAGVLRPLPYRELPATRAADAFLLMVQARHVGKVLIAFPEGIAAPAPTCAPLAIRDDATYLVAGGLGGIGARVAAWLIDRGARDLLLVGRTPLSGAGDRAAVLRDLEGRGARVEYAAVDVADIAGMGEVLAARERAERPPVRGAVHAAGVVDYRAIVDLDADAVAAVLRPKVRGAWVLHRLLARESLDFFVLFSSGLALLSSPFLGGYAAGNAFLDALAHHRRAAGLPATAIGWGFWSEVGMVARKQTEDGRSLVPPGMSGIDTERGIAVLQQALAEDLTQVAVLPTDWPEWRRSHPAAGRSPLLRNVASEPATSVVAAPAPRSVFPEAEPTPALAHRLDPGDDRIDALLVEQVARVLGMSSDRVRVDRPLNRMGMDSLMAVDFRNRVERELKVRLPIVHLLNDGTVATVARAVREELSGRS